MFDRIINFLERLLPRAIDNSFEQAVREHGDVLKNYIVENQLYNRGIDGNEKKLAGYSRTTISIKRAKRQPVDRTTLRDTGKFHDSVTVHATTDGFYVTTDVYYDTYLFKDYGPDIIKITNENMRDFVRDYVLKKVKQNADQIN